MTSEQMMAFQLAQQQTSAAWVSAYAAVAQAIGAIFAIGVSIKLARDSAAREIAAQEAAQRRIDAADKASDKRMEREAAAVHNAPILRAVTMVELAAEEVAVQLEVDRQRYANYGGTIVGVIHGRDLTAMMEAIPDLKMAVHDEASVQILATLQKDIDLRQGIAREGGASYIAYIEAQLNTLRTAAADLRRQIK